MKQMFRDCGDLWAVRQCDLLQIKTPHKEVLVESLQLGTRTEDDCGQLVTVIEQVHRKALQCVTVDKRNRLQVVAAIEKIRWD